MGKRTNAIALRLASRQRWQSEASRSDHLKKADPRFSQKLTFALKRSLWQFKVELLHTLVLRPSFVCQVYAFVCGPLPLSRRVFLGWRIRALFGKLVRLRLYDVRRYFKRKSRRTRPIESFLIRYRWYKDNAFFHATSVYCQFGFVLRSADALCAVVVRLLRKHNRHWVAFKFLKLIGDSYYNKSKADVGGGLYGLLVQVSGKINGRPRKKKRVFRWGTMPLQTISRDIDYSYRAVTTKFGVFGVKVWVNRAKSRAPVT